MVFWCVDPNCESRKTKSAFYIPRDECFDKTKMSDFMADGLRSMTHSASSKTMTVLTRKAEFDSVEEIKKLFAPKGKDVGGLNNTLPKKANVATHEQHPLVFLDEVLKPDGQKENNPLRYPMPKILQSAFLSSKFSLTTQELVHVCTWSSCTLFLQEVFFCDCRRLDDVATDCCRVSQPTIRRGERTTSLPGSFWRVLTPLSFRTSR